jgi:hypothetical protein
MKDFNNLLFRASQVSLICTGKIGLTETQDFKLKELSKEKETGLNSNGNKVKWTPNKQSELEKLISEKKEPSLPKTLLTEVRKIYRSEIHNRNFNFTNKYTQKGTRQEEEAITLYQMYLMSKNYKVLFTKNKERLSNTYITGMPDLIPIVLNGKKTGFDTKCSWELETFPFEHDELDAIYEYQNQSYMWLTGAEEWITVYALVNIHETGLHNEKLKYWYAMETPQDAADKYYDDYIEKCKELERRLIFDYDRFKLHFPKHDLETSRDEWMETINPFTGLKGYDMVLKDRIIEKKSVFDQDKINFIKERIDVCRKELYKLHDKK